MASDGLKDAAQLAEQLAEGFVALTGEYQALFHRQRQLESKLSWAKQQYLDALKRYSPASLSQDHLAFLQELERIGEELPPADHDLVDQLIQCDDAEGKSRASVLRQAEVAAARVRVELGQNGVKIWSGPSADISTSPSLKSNLDMTPMEKDFTTAGTPSRLGCPFASRSGRGSPLATPHSSTSRLSLRGRRSKRPSFTDPIRAEICGNDVKSASPSVAASGSAAVCPIRFLDQHDPEEVARYFEKHKHELPRSHEVCITRFQSNQESIEQLDRKYGNLVNMIQGLGQKHQAWLPEDPEDILEDEREPEVEVTSDSKADLKVENWAKAVSASLHEETVLEEGEVANHNMDDMATSHFDRPLKEVRVGESPSRPWGIQIPAKYTNAESSSSVGSAPTASPQLPLVGETPRPRGKCPIDHGAMGNLGLPQTPHPMPQTPSPQESSHKAEAPIPTKVQDFPRTEAEAPRVVPQMVFNGPVFLGYPPDQLMALLQNSNLGSVLR